MSELSHRRTTRFSRFDPVLARIVLGLSVLLIVWFVTITFSSHRNGFADKPPMHGSDIALYQAEVERVAAGENYYAAAAAELRARGYPTKSVFNWRTPLPMVLIGSLPDPQIGRVILGGLALLLLVLARAAIARHGSWVSSLVAVILLIGAILFCVMGQSYMMPVLWAGVLIGLSLSAFGLKRPGWGVTFGVAAALMRDLAVPYCGLAMIIALSQRRWRELGWWSLGLVGYVSFFVWHVLQVQAVQTPADAAHPGSWLQFGGLPFVISLAQVNAFWINHHQSVAAVFLALSLVGFAGWQGQWAGRVGLTTLGYVVGFCFIGYDFNQYWGAMLGPLLVFGFVQSPAAIRDLWCAAKFSVIPTQAGIQ